MPKEHFEKVDRLVARARANPAIRKEVVRGLRSMLKTFEGYLEQLELPCGLQRETHNK
jgi:hypothetical protein